MKLFGIKDFATFKALNEFTIFVSGDDSYPRVFAGAHNSFAVSWIKLLFPQIVATFL